jgi:hypothetical protein
VYLCRLANPATFAVVSATAAAILTLEINLIRPKY